MFFVVVWKSFFAINVARKTRKSLNYDVWSASAEVNEWNRSTYSRKVVQIMMDPAGFQSMLGFWAFGDFLILFWNLVRI